uniref:Lysosome-associated membrane glycoprotein 5 n=1 Tax=Timema genevievae TaxID=629358 RepID=A0A7R9PH97_TIMGE|nr:unnamed protein product [Timema genevievae]
MSENSILPVKIQSISGPCTIARDYRVGNTGSGRAAVTKEQSVSSQHVTGMYSKYNRLECSNNLFHPVCLPTELSLMSLIPGTVQKCIIEETVDYLYTLLVKQQGNSRDYTSENKIKVNIPPQPLTSDITTTTQTPTSPSTTTIPPTTTTTPPTTITTPPTPTIPPTTTTTPPSTTTNPPTTTTTPPTTITTPPTTTIPPTTPTTPPSTTTNPPTNTTTPPTTTTTIPPTTTPIPPTNTTTPPPTTPLPTTPPPTTQPPTTTTAPVTTPKPSPKPEPGTWVVQNHTTNVTCIIVEMAMQVNVSYAISANETKHLLIDGPKTVGNVTGNCGAEKQVISLWWVTETNQTNKFALEFHKNDTTKQFWLAQINILIMLDPKVYPDVQNLTELHLVSSSPEFNTPVSMSYRCMKKQLLNLTMVQGNTTVATLEISNTQIEAFRDKTDTVFGVDHDCLHPRGPSVALVPIAVICVLVIFLLAILLVTIIRRRQSQAHGYLGIFNLYTASTSLCMCYIHMNLFYYNFKTVLFSSKVLTLEAGIVAPVSRPLIPKHFCRRARICACKQSLVCFSWARRAWRRTSNHGPLVGYKSNRDAYVVWSLVADQPNGGRIGRVAVKPTGQAAAKVPKVANAKESQIGTIVSDDIIPVEKEDAFNSSNTRPYKITFSNTSELNIQNMQPMKIGKGLFPKYKSVASIVPAGKNQIVVELLCIKEANSLMADRELQDLLKDSVDRVGRNEHRIGVIHNIPLEFLEEFIKEELER